MRHSKYVRLQRIAAEKCAAEAVTRKPGYGVRPLESQWEIGGKAASQIAKPVRA
jgi:hypothetical protein